MAKLIIDSPGKVNLYLNVLGLRPDGYHRIQTIFRTIDLKDEIELEETGSGISLDSDSDLVPKDKTNLAWLAAETLIDKCRIKAGIKIFIKKNIPVAAGLGGGSSNAASVLLGLNQLWDLGLSKDELAEIGCGLGADVPFFVREYTLALAAGIGEELVPLDSSQDIKFILVNPGIEVSTPGVYKQWDELSLSQSGLSRAETDIKDIIKKLESGQIENIETFLYNSLEPAALSLHPVINQVKQSLTDSGLGLNLMSGSGPTVFGILRDGKEGATLGKKVLSCNDWRVYLA